MPLGGTVGFGCAASMARSRLAWLSTARKVSQAVNADTSMLHAGALTGPFKDMKISGRVPVVSLAPVRTSRASSEPAVRSTLPVIDRSALLISALNDVWLSHARPAQADHRHRA